MVQPLRQVPRGGVAGHLVVLDPLRRSDEREVGCGIVLLLALRHDLFALLDEPHHALARLCAGGRAQEVEAFV
jgi:hypothetical protein